MPPVHSHSSSHVTTSYKMEASTMKCGMQTCNIKHFSFLLLQNVLPILREVGHAVITVVRLTLNANVPAYMMYSASVCARPEESRVKQVHITEARICYQSFCLFLSSIIICRLQINPFRPSPNHSAT
jgi:hypothetical protein